LPFLPSPSQFPLCLRVLSIKADLRGVGDFFSPLHPTLAPCPMLQAFLFPLSMGITALLNLHFSIAWLTVQTQSPFSTQPRQSLVEEGRWRRFGTSSFISSEGRQASFVHRLSNPLGSILDRLTLLLLTEFGLRVLPLVSNRFPRSPVRRSLSAFVPSLNES